MALSETQESPVFEIGDRVDVVAGIYAGDRGVVVKPPVDMRPEYVLVQLIRAHVLRYLPVERLQHRY